MADDPYIGGLRAARAICWERCKQREEKAAKHHKVHRARAAAYMIEALEAARCAEDIGRLIAEREDGPR